MLAINEAKYAGNYCISLVFNNGRKGVANLKEAIFNDKRPIFSELKDESNFKDFKLEHILRTFKFSVLTFCENLVNKRLIDLILTLEHQDDHPETKLKTTGRSL